MRMIACVSPVTEGTLPILDLDPDADGPRIRGRLGVVPQQDTLDTEISVRDNLVIYGRYFGLTRAEAARRADELLEFTQLTERANDKVEPLSGGMKRRLTIARALINEPSILLLDEPTTGLDPQARHLLWERLYRLKQRGVTLVLTTHYMDEAEQLCDRLVVMDKAKIVAEGSPRELIDEYSTREVTELRFPVEVHDALDGQLDGHRRAHRAPARSRARLLRRRRGGRGRRPRARPPSRDRPRPAELARGRVPAAHRAEPHRVTAMTRRAARPRRIARCAAAGGDVPRPSPVGGALAAYEHMWLLYRRTWRGSIFGNFAQPVLFLVAMGIGLGSYVNQADPASLQGVPYLQFLAPALLVSTVMQGVGVRGHVPRARRVPLDPPLPRDVRDAAGPVRDRVRPDRLDRDPRDARRLDLRARDPRCSTRRRRWASCSRSRSGR